MNADLCGSGSTALVIIRNNASQGVGHDQALELHFTFLPFPHSKQRLFENCLKEKVFRSSYIFSNAGDPLQLKLTGFYFKNIIIASPSLAEEACVKIPVSQKMHAVVLEIL